jgi:hypothetical protein
VTSVPYPSRSQMAKVQLRTGDSLVGARFAGLQPGGGKKRKKTKAEDAALLSMLEDDAFLRSVCNAVGSI